MLLQKIRKKLIKEISNMKKYLYFIALIVVISGCVPYHQTGFVKYPEIQSTSHYKSKPGYTDAYKECERMAVAANINSVNSSNTLDNAATGAIVGALTGAAFGADIATVSGVGAATGVITTDQRQPQYNQNEYKRIMLDCMRDRGYQVY